MPYGIAVTLLHVVCFLILPFRCA